MYNMICKGMISHYITNPLNYKMAYNRLRLNWDLDSQVERTQFVQEYLPTLQNPTAAELDTISNYILWGKDSKGLTPRQSKEYEIEAKHSTWNRKPTESLEALMESPTFNESTLHQPGDPIYRIPKPKFPRERTRKTAPPDVLPEFEKLWAQIDQLEYKLHTYQFQTGKRTAPPRDELVSQIPEGTRAILDTQAARLTPYQALKLAHELAALRDDQYTLRDTYAPVLQPLNLVPTPPQAPPTFDSEINVRPLGIPTNSTLSSKIWNPERLPIPTDFTPEDQRAISTLLWTIDPSLPTIDLTDPD